MKGIDIFNVKAVSNKIENPGVPNVYHRIYDATKGNDSGLTEQLLNQTIQIIEADSKSVLDALKAKKEMLFPAPIEVPVEKPVAKKGSRKKAA